MKKYIYITIMTFLVLFLVLPIACTEIVEIAPANAKMQSSSPTPNDTAVSEQEALLSEGTESSAGEPEYNSTEELAAEITIDIDRLQELEGSFGVLDAFPDLSFNKPLDIQNAGDGTGRLFIVEQQGRIFVTDSSTAISPTLFLDISNRVDDSGNEEGLLGLAFHPDFILNGEFFVNYTNNKGTVVSRFKLNENDRNTADPDSEEVILTLDQPFSNHNGGQIAFGPEDGFLYIATGDGGSAGDPEGNGQDLKTLLGKILRIDVNNKDAGLAYSIPEDNPFAGNVKGYREEIYAYGLRNPWRFSFDAATGILWAADVGQDAIEEIDIIRKGQNYGWNIMEGSQCYKPPSGCDTEGLVLPVYEYQHSLGKSVTGGYVYHGNNIGVLEGVYIYADFVSGYIWGLVYTESGQARNFTLVDTGLNISSFGVDEDQNLYFSAFDGKIYALSSP